MHLASAKCIKYLYYAKLIKFLGGNKFNQMGFNSITLAIAQQPQGCHS